MNHLLLEKDSSSEEDIHTSFNCHIVSMDEMGDDADKEMDHVHDSCTEDNVRDVDHANNSVISSLNVQMWVTSSLSYLKVPEGVELGGGSMEEIVLKSLMLTFARNFSLPARDMGAWAVCIPAIIEQWLVIDMNECHVGIKRFEVTVIKTSFGHFHRNNMTFPARTDRRENAVWTERERAKAEAGEVVQDLHDLSDKMYTYAYQCVFFKEFELTNGDFSGALHLHNSDGSLMAFVCPLLPKAICCGLTSSLLACFDGEPVLRVCSYQKDSQDQDVDKLPQGKHGADVSLEKLAEKVLSRPFQCLYFSLWNRYSTTVDEAPTHIHPQNMARVDTLLWSINSSIATS
ncbi:uncharacterized protein HD556DRAFT_1310549 [Suillus plorans]|uniref:Uncharacterized protein n=1 Tax=Suillus plorans TaxID=116603 RepID=A0A9P7AJC6_9AGAM|nr:uncharacterized protein HD556DRAFT_1310549 [Suillus plorans]KAG1790535.1 hypothetical protein HD556DRAFT_1310549 [Suillus plorans]